MDIMVHVGSNLNDSLIKNRFSRFKHISVRCVFKGEKILLLQLTTLSFLCIVTTFLVAVDVRKGATETE